MSTEPDKNRVAARGCAVPQRRKELGYVQRRCGRTLRFQQLQWLFPVAVTLHNAEEAITMPGWISVHGNQLPLHPKIAAIELGLVLLTAAAYAVTYLSAHRGKGSVWAYLLFGYITAMLENVLLPHVPATLVFRQYTPGVASAILINFPVMSVLLFRAVREQWVSGLRAIAAALLVPLAIAGAIAALFIIA
jgi:uncharacterized protein with HXXEE motif